MSHLSQYATRTIPLFMAYILKHLVAVHGEEKYKPTQKWIRR